MNHDAWRRNALTATGWEIYEALLRVGEATSINELTRLTSRSTPAVRKALARLEGVGLAYRQGTLWAGEKVGEGRLDEIAESFGTKGVLDAKKEFHESERQRLADLAFRGWAPQTG